MTNSTSIQFGTSGYRGIVPDTFNQNHVEPISRSIAALLLQQSAQPRVFIGYDPRSGNTEPTGFPTFCAQLLAEMGVDVAIATRPVPTPLVSWAVKTQRFDGGIIFTASHNPPSYNGVKFNPYPGGPAPESVTKAIESQCQTANWPPASGYGQITPVDYVGLFASYVTQYVTQFVAVNGPISVVVDCRHGTAAPIWRAISELGYVNLVGMLHTEMRSDFGGIDPNPTALGAVDALGQQVKSLGATIGIAHDPDADRHVIVDESGNPVSPEMVAAVIALDCIRRNRSISGIVSTVASSSIVRSICRHLNIDYFETAVGFKQFTPHFLASDMPLIGVESSGGFSVSDYLHEKCGFLPGLWLGAIATSRQMRVSEMVAEVRDIVGRPTFIETSFRFDPNDRQRLSDQLSEIKTWDGLMDCEINRLDGWKWVGKDGSWILIRFSGTEPLGRVYVESPSHLRADQIVGDVMAVIQSV